MGLGPALTMLYAFSMLTTRMRASAWYEDDWTISLRFSLASARFVKKTAICTIKESAAGGAPAGRLSNQCFFLITTCAPTKAAVCRIAIGD